MFFFWLPKDNQDEERDVEPKLGKPELLFKVNTTEHFSDINKMSSLIVSVNRLIKFHTCQIKKQEYG